jgi:prolyl-tRNA synthetase
MATEAEVLEKGIVPGAASPAGTKGIRIIADDSVISAHNLVAGGNKPDTHVRNLNYGRDFQADLITDIALAQAGHYCSMCTTPLTAIRGIEVGHIFKLGTLYSEKLGAYFTDENGSPYPITMGCYGIGLGRLLAAAVEQNHDEKGIIWPAPIAPYQVHLCPLYREGSRVAEVTENLYRELQSAGIEALLDDREESAGVKFNDADLLGMPLRLTVSPRTLEKESIEVKWRNEKKAQLLPLEGIVGAIKEMLSGHV